MNSTATTVKPDKKPRRTPAAVTLWESTAPPITRLRHFTLPSAPGGGHSSPTRSDEVHPRPPHPVDLCRRRDRRRCQLCRSGAAAAERPAHPGRLHRVRAQANPPRRSAARPSSSRPRRSSPPPRRRSTPASPRRSSCARRPRCMAASMLQGTVRGVGACVPAADPGPARRPCSAGWFAVSRVLAQLDEYGTGTSDVLPRSLGASEPERHLARVLGSRTGTPLWNRRILIEAFKLTAPNTWGRLKAPGRRRPRRLLRLARAAARDVHGRGERRSPRARRPRRHPALRRAQADPLVPPAGGLRDPA